MFEILKESTANTLVAHFGGKVTGEEYQQFVDAVEERLKGAEPVNLVLVLPDVKFYADFAALKKDYQFSKGEYKQIRKAALVGDQKWIEWYTKLASHTTTEQKQFHADQTQAAIDWACA